MRIKSLIVFLLNDSYLLSFYDDLQVKPKTLHKINEKEKMHNTESELYNKRFKNYYDEYNK